MNPSIRPTPRHRASAVNLLRWHRQQIITDRDGEISGALTPATLQQLINGRWQPMPTIIERIKR